MKLYVKSVSSYRSDLESIDIKQELKQKYKYDPRRQDAFIHLGVLGAKRLQEAGELQADDELYVTSGLGNIDILQRNHQKVTKEGGPLKPIDFINMLGNTVSYYIASAIGLKGKTIFQISDQFTYFRTLVSVWASLRQSGKHGVLAVCDLVSVPEGVSKRLSGIEPDQTIVSSVSCQRVSLSDENAFAEISFSLHPCNKEQLQARLLNLESKVLVSPRCKELLYPSMDVFFENTAGYAVNEAIRLKENLFFVDCFGENYQWVQLKIL